MVTFKCWMKLFKLSQRAVPWKGFRWRTGPSSSSFYSKTLSKNGLCRVGFGLVEARHWFGGISPRRSTPMAQLGDKALPKLDSRLFSGAVGWMVMSWSPELVPPHWSWGVCMFEWRGIKGWNMETRVTGSPLNSLIFIYTHKLGSHRDSPTMRRSLSCLCLGSEYVLLAQKQLLFRCLVSVEYSSLWHINGCAVLVALGFVDDTKLCH